MANQGSGAGSRSSHPSLERSAGSPRSGFSGDELRVEDSGPGVPPEDRERIFERFFSRREGGTGVGLALARAIAQAHQGSLHVEDSELGGAAFVLQLPNSEVT